MNEWLTIANERIEIKEKILDFGSISLLQGSFEHSDVIIKLAAANGNNTNVWSLKKEYEILKDLKYPGYVLPRILIAESDKAALIYPQFSFNPLSTIIDKRIDVKQFLKIAIHLVKTIVWFHNNGIILNGIFPSGIAIGTDGSVLWLESSRSTRLESTNKLDVSEFGEWFLNYVSPEQSGISKTRIDTRSDLYNVGAIFFHMLTGSPAFSDPNHEDLLFKHLATVPDDPSTINPRIPEILSGIILLLLKKNPIDRYQTALGLLKDLELSSTSLSREGRDVNFPLRSKDIITRLKVSQKFYGRKQELEILDGLGKMANSGKKQVAFISGYSGVGKTRLVEEASIGFQLTFNFYINAKFDLFQRTTPYSAMLDATRSIIKKLLVQDDKELAYWKERLNQILGDGQAVLGDVIPELRYILGDLPSPPELPPDETENRFKIASINFVRCFSSDNHTITFFLDDLQWADPASLTLIKLLLLDEGIQNMLFIGSYRSNEVSSTHPLTRLISDTGEQMYVNEIALTTLTKESIQDLIKDTLSRFEGNIEPLVNYIFKMTQGNVFHTIQLIQYMVELDVLRISKLDNWEWVNDGDVMVGNDIADLLVHKISLLKENEIQLIKKAAVLGDAFFLQTLASIEEKPITEVAAILVNPFQNGLISSVDKHFDSLTMIKSFSDKDLEEMGETRLMFSHDRIRQAILKSSNAQDMASLNLKAGRYKLKSFNKEKLEKDLYYITKNFNEAIELIKDEDEAGKIINLNYRAGMRAKSATAYWAAIEYFDFGLKFCSRFSLPNRVYDFEIEKAESLYLLGKHAEAQKLLDALYDDTPERIKRLEICMRAVRLNTTIDNKITAINFGSKGLALYGISIPKNELLLKLNLMWDLIRGLIFVPKPKRKILDLPQIKDKEVIKLLELIFSMTPAAYQYSQDLFGLLVLKMFNISIKKGNSGRSSFAYLGFGMIQVELFNQYKTLKQLSDIAIELNKKLGYDTLKWKLSLSYHNFVHHWTEEIRSSIDDLPAIEIGAINQGDPVFAGYCIFNYLSKKLSLGFNLLELRVDFQDYFRIVDNRGDKETRRFLEPMYTFLCWHIGEEVDAVSLNTPEYKSNKIISESIENASFSIVADLYIMHTQLLYYSGNFEEALRVTKKSDEFVRFVSMRYETSVYQFYRGLVWAECFGKGLIGKSKANKEIKKSLRKLKMWTKNCANNFEPMYLLLVAEQKQVLGKNESAAHTYESAISSAQKFQFLNLSALAFLRTGLFYDKQGKSLIAKAYFEKAIVDFEEWGSPRMVIQTKSIGNYFPRSGSDVITKINWQDKLAKLKNVNDLQDAGGEIIRIAVLSSLSSKGFLISKETGDLQVLKMYTQSTDKITNIESRNTSDIKVSMQVLRLAERTQEIQWISNPSHLADFHNDFVDRQDLKYLICIPIFFKKELYALLYLENNFSNEISEEIRKQVIQTSSQISTIVENIVLHTRRDERVEQAEDDKKKSEDLLKSILPEAAIKELKSYGRVKAITYEDATVLFADIKGFTTISENISPEQLIEGIEFYFTHFDEIVMKFGLDKIKTIGDAYMAVTSLDEVRDTLALDAVNAAVEMQLFARGQQVNREKEQKPAFEIRIGLHSGSIIGGVIGKTKIQYDIWGDTVNTTVRMQEACEPGKINISAQTYDHIKDNVKCIPRGKIRAKHKGEIEMFYVDLDHFRK